MVKKEKKMAKCLLTAPSKFQICGSESAELTQQQMVSLAANCSAVGLSVAILAFDETAERITERFESYCHEKDIKKIFIKECRPREIKQIDTLIRTVKKATKCSVVIINHIADGILSGELIECLDQVAKSCKLRIYFFAQLGWLRGYLRAKRWCEEIAGGEKARRAEESAGQSACT